MTLTQLRHLVGLAQAGSFAQAARLLFLTQPALSRSIQALEDELGAPLFDRLGRRIALTPLGQEVLERARRLVSEAEALKQVSQGLQAGLIGRLRVGLSSAPGVLLSRPFLAHMARHHPRLQVEISRGNTSVLIDALREQRLDAAVVDVRSVRPAADLRIDQVFELSAGFLVRPGHPLLRRRKALSFGDVLAYPMASTPLSDEVARLLMARYGAQANPDDCVTLRSDETHHLVEVARHSDVVVLTVCAAAPGLVPVPLQPAFDATGRFGMVTLARRSAAPALRIVREALPSWLPADAVSAGPA